MRVRVRVRVRGGEEGYLELATGEEATVSTGTRLVKRWGLQFEPKIGSSEKV